MTEDIQMKEETTLQTVSATVDSRSASSGDDRAESQQWLRPGEKPFQGIRRLPDDGFDPFSDIPHCL